MPMTTERTRTEPTTTTALAQAVPEMNPFEAVSYFFDQAAEHIQLSQEMRSVLRGTYRELRV